MDDLEKRKKIHLEVKLKFASDEIICGEGFLRLCELVDETGSLQKASEQMNLSYTKAWKMLKSVENKTSVKLISRVVGGEHGGRSELTEEGREFVKRYQGMKRELNEEADKIFEKYFVDFYL